MSAPNATLYIKNLNDQVQKDELRAQLYSLFTTHGKIIDVIASKSVKMRGQAFLVFSDLAGATTAMRACEGMMFYDKPMHIEYAKTKSYATLQKEDPNFVHPSLSKKPLPAAILANGVSAEKRVREDDDDDNERGRKREKSGNEEEIDEMEIEEDEGRTQGDANGHPVTILQPVVKHPTAALLCTNLPQEVTDDVLSVLFQQYQGFQSTHVAQSPTSTASGRAKLAQVAFDSPDLASVAKEALDGFTLKKGWYKHVVIHVIGLTNSSFLLTNLFASGLELIETMNYHRIISSTLRIPTEVSTPVPVGLLACQRDPLLKQLETNVVICTASQGLEVTKDKKRKNQPTPQAGLLFEVLLQDTILFPEGGGQPSDIGLIKFQDGTIYDVLEVKRRGGHAIHYLKGDKATANLLVPGARVTVLLGDDGFKRRYDHMCMHTCQHVISALLETRLNLPTSSWYLTQSPGPSYIEVPRAPTVEELKSIEEAANDYCMQGTRLYIEVEDLDDTTRENGDRNSSKGLPADYAGGVNRTVVIEGVDRNPCCGTHLPTLQGLSVFILPQTEGLSRGRARIFFCAGPRVRAYLCQTHNLLTAAATGYGCAPAQIPERLAFETDGRRKANKRNEELEDEVAAFIAKDLLAERCLQIRNEEKRRFTTFHHRNDSSPNPLALLTMVHSTWCASFTADAPPFLVILVSSSVQSPNNAVVLVFGSEENEVKEVGDQFKARGIKGGGKPGKWSGKTERWREAGGDEWIRAMLGLNSST